MSVIGSSISQKPAAAAADKPMLTPEQVIEQLHALRDQIPEFVQLPNNRELQQLRRIARLDGQLTREAMSVVGGAVSVQGVVGTTPDELRQAEDDASRWASVESEFRAVLRGVSAANLVRRYRIARAVQKVYRVGRSLVDQEEFSNLVPHVETMARIKKGRRSKPAPPPDDQKKQ